MNRQIFQLLALLFLFGCGQTETKKVIEKYDNGNESIVFYYKDKSDTLTYRKEVFYESGKRTYVGNIVNNKKEGVWTWWYENGNKKDQCKYLNGKEIDTIFHWYENGKLKQFDVLRQGKVSADNACTVCCNMTTMRYFENGNPKETFTNVDDIQQDTAKYWYENGQLEQVGTYKNGKQHGFFKMYYSNGQIKYDANFVDGWEEGKAIQWDSLGKVTATIIWKDKKVISEK